MRRATSFLLTLAVLIGCLSLGSPWVYAAEMTISQEGLQLLKEEEGFSKYPYWDFSQYTVGYGTACPSDMVDYYKKNGITENEAETLLRNYMSGMEYTLNRYIEKHNLTLTQNQYDAIALFSYNVGTAWTNGSVISDAIISGATGNELLRAFGMWCKAGGQIQTFLLRRRMSEANLYLNGVYSKEPPENYGYVIHAPNGGGVCHSSQVFDSALPQPSACVATKTGYTFMGWYTALVGGNKITLLDASVKGATLYAQWLPDAWMAYYTDTTDVLVKITGNGVNFRGGPGTDSDKIGAGYAGDTVLVTETLQLDETLWGRTEKGWLALQYTNFAEVYNALPPITEPTEPETTVPETTVPETTVPETTVPETTVPETTVPETTIPETTVPETTVPEVTLPPVTEPPVTQWKGKVTASTLNVRATPGGKLVGYYPRNAQVMILEKTTVDGMPWGRTDKGWICLTYVELEEPPVTEPPATEPPATEPPATEPPATEPPVTEPPATEPPVTEPPATEPPLIQWQGKVTASSLNVRATPGGKLVGYYLRNDKVVILEKTTVDGTPWGRTDKGWICLTYVALEEPPVTEPPTTEPPVTEPPVTEPPVTEPPVTEPPVTEPPVTQWNGKVTASTLNVRATPGGKLVGYYPRNAKVVILEKTTVDGTAWGRTDKGWICLTYVELTDPTPDPVVKTVIADVLRVRSGPGTTYSIVTTLKNGTKVTIYETKTVNGDLWGRTDNGWVSMTYVQ